MSVSKQNLISGFTGAVMAASTVFSPTTITAQEIQTAAGTQDNVQMASLEAAPVILRYGANIQNIDFVSEYVASLGIAVTLEAGYSNPECGEAEIGSSSISFSQMDIYNGNLGAYIQTAAEGIKNVSYLPSCDGQA